jgi:predicted ATP-grasp superfamily ATP-dependent carboligase
MSAHPETGRPFSAVTPLVKGGDGNAEVFGKLWDGEEPVSVFHAFDHRQDPVDSMSLVSMVGMTGFSTGLLTLC